MESTAYTAIHPRGDAEARSHPYLEGQMIGAVKVGPSMTIQSTDPAHLEQLADALYEAARQVRAGVPVEVPA